VAGPAKAGASPPAGAPITVDLQAAMHASDSSRDVPIQPGDVVVIPQTGMARLQWLVTILAPWFAPIYLFR
jgi:hypothetical protein